MDGRDVVLFDGSCNFCNGSVRFIMRHDSAARFAFASVQTPAGRELAQKHGFTGPTPGSMVLIRGGRCYTRTTASLMIARRLDGLWPLLYALILVPRPLRDAVYKWFAARRHRFFGVADQCVPIPAERRVDS
jgi:predicted DCC family thiol-disulfide oxidoreductase YuxK